MALFKYMWLKDSHSSGEMEGRGRKVTECSSHKLSGFTTAQHTGELHRNYSAATNNSTDSIC